MKNVTLSVDEKVLAAVRRYAAERNVTVNGLVRDYFEQIAAMSDRASRARRRIRLLSKQSTLEVGPKTWSRDDLHER